MMKFFIIVFSSFLFIAKSQIPAKVVGIKDGDTIVVLLEGNIEKTLRLAEVDCPEKGQAYGKNAKQFTSEQIFGKEITFVPTNEDKYGRTIAKVYYDQKYLSAEIIKAGFGWWYFKYSDNKLLGELQKYAETKKIGLWQDKNALSPWDFRASKRIKKIS
ncbi:thermonuclease family protein [Chryseobacterium sp. T1]